MPNSVLKINGVEVDRDAADVVLDRFQVGNFEGPTELQFTQSLRTSPGYVQRSEVRLEIDGVLQFRGRITDVSQNETEWGYTAQGGAYLMNLCSITHPQYGTGSPGLVYNAAPDEADYDAGLVGLSVGEIIEEVLTVDQIATDLWNAGIEAYEDAPDDPLVGYDTIGGDPPVLKAATLDDLALMTTVPLRSVRLSGQRLWTSITGIITEFAPTFRFRIFPDGTIRCTDTRTLPSRTLTLGTDPIRLPKFQRESRDCATAIRARGKPNVAGWWFSLMAGDLEEDWTAQEEANWTYADFLRPYGAYSSCDITDSTSDTITVSVVDGLDSWDADYWPGLMAQVTLIEDAASGNITYQAMRRIVTNTSLTLGGTSVLTLDFDLPIGSGFNRCEIVGIANGSHVHRRYVFAADRQAAARRILKQFPYAVATATLGTENQGAVITSVPFGWNVRLSSGGNVGQPFPLQFTIFTDPNDGLVKIITVEPTCKQWTQQADLDIGGDAVTKPDDVRVFVPVATGALEVRVPAADADPPWSGRAYTIHGLEYEQIIDLEGWVYAADRSQAEAFATDLLDSLKDPVVSGAVEYVGFDGDAVEAGGIEAIIMDSVAAFDELDADLAGVPLPVHSVEVRWLTGPGNATNFATTINVSNRTFPYHGERGREPDADAVANSSINFADFARAYGFFTDESNGRAGY